MQGVTCWLGASSSGAGSGTSYSRRVIRSSTSMPMSWDGHIDREEAADDAALLHARQIEMAEIVAFQKIALRVRLRRASRRRRTSL